jgi:hypothetical protein
MGPQFKRNLPLPGGLFDRGMADNYYSRPRNPHWWNPVSGKRISKLNAAEIAEYNAGYDFNELYGDKKSY